MTRSAASDHAGRFPEIANEALGQARFASDTPPNVAVPVEDATAGVQALLSIATASEEGLSHWDAQQRDGLVPLAGAETKRREIRENADTLTRQAQTQFQTARAEAEGAVIESGKPPRPTGDDQALALDLLHDSLDADGPIVKARLLKIAQSGDDRVRGLLGDSGYLRDKLITRGVEGVDAFVSQLDRITATTGSSPAAQQAAAGLDKLAKLDAAATAAQAAVRHALRAS